MLFTPILNLQKPQDSDPVDELPFNTNSDELDAATGIQKLTQGQINALAASQAPDGLVVYNTSTGNHQMRQGSAWHIAATLDNYQQTAHLAADQAGTGAMANIGALTFNILAGETWACEIALAVTTSTSGLGAYQLTGPAAPTSVDLFAVSTGANSVASKVAGFSTATTVLSGGSTSNTSVIIIRATIVNGTNAGAVTLQGNAPAASIYKAGAQLRAWRTN